MWSLHTANEDHWVPIATVASFKRMRTYNEMGIPWVANALRKYSEGLEVDESSEKVRRANPVEEPKGVWERSIYAVRFPLHLLDHVCGNLANL